MLKREIIKNNYKQLLEIYKEATSLEKLSFDDMLKFNKTCDSIRKCDLERMLNEPIREASYIMMEAIY